MIYHTEFSKLAKFRENLLQLRGNIRTQISQFSRNVEVLYFREFQADFHKTTHFY